MSNHITLLANLDAGLSCSGEAAAAIRQLEAEIERLTILQSYVGELEDKVDRKTAEIERLTSVATARQCRMAEQAAEIERLRDEVKAYEDAGWAWAIR